MMSEIEDAKEILRLDSQGFFSTLRFVREIADIFCNSRNAPPVGINWANVFVKRTSALQAKLGTARMSGKTLREHRSY